MKTLKSLFFDTLADMYDAEKQLTKALPRMSMAAQSAELKETIDSHLAETEGHVQTVEEVFECFGVKPRTKRCEATAGLLKEGDGVARDFEGSPALDAAIISSAQKIEHYEMASYGCLHTWAQLLGNEEAADLLAGILEEEKLADAALNELALAQINEQAMDPGDEGDDEDEDEETDGLDSPTGTGRQAGSLI
jgi:ferritin-like metal-binding protein YciE